MDGFVSVWSYMADLAAALVVEYHEEE